MAKTGILTGILIRFALKVDLNRYGRICRSYRSEGVHFLGEPSNETAFRPFHGDNVRFHFKEVELAVSFHIFSRNFLGIEIGLRVETGIGQAGVLV